MSAHGPTLQGSREIRKEANCTEKEAIEVGNFWLRLRSQPS